MKRILAAALLAFAAGAHAQYPNRAIKLVVPFTPGTGIDILARVVAPRLQERGKAPVVVENRPGASGNIGTEAVAKSAPDGYTLLVTATTLVQSAVLHKSVPYDPKALTPIAHAAVGNLALVARILRSARARCRTWSGSSGASPASSTTPRRATRRRTTLPWSSSSSASACKWCTCRTRGRRGR
jgi:hypothetical protein